MKASKKREKAPVQKPTEGKNRAKGKSGGKTFFGYAPAGRKGKKA